MKKSFAMMLILAAALSLLPKVYAENSISDGLILLPGGTFLMGSPETERMRQTDETQHEVTIGSFYADPCEVRQKDYERVMGVNPSHFKGPDLPVENVTWYDAVAYCNALSEEAGLTPVYAVNGNTVSWNRAADGYRLLTEAEWEYAARAGTQTIFYNGDQVHSDQYNFEASYPYLIEENYVHHRDSTVVTSRYRGRTVNVDELAPNAFGMYNMLGNVSEWCFDYYGDYDLENTVDPAGAVSGHLRINRGGSYIDFGKHLRCAYRSAVNPIDPDQNTGFRICRNAGAKDQIVSTAYDLNISLPENPKTLLVYFSYSGNTQEAAAYIGRLMDIEPVEIEMAHPYRGNIYDVSQYDLMREIRPELTTRIDGIERYDLILLGYPTWWATMPMPVYSFLESYDFTGKTIISFSSHGGTMFGDSVSDLCKTVPGAYVGIAYEFNYSGWDEGEIAEWLAMNGISVK